MHPSRRPIWILSESWLPSSILFCAEARPAILLVRLCWTCEESGKAQMVAQVQKKQIQAGKVRGGTQMALFKRGKWWWTDFSVNGVRYRQPIRDKEGHRTKDWREALSREKELIAQAH